MPYLFNINFAIYICFMIVSNNKNNKLQRLGEQTLEYWCALRDLYLPKEREEILKRVENHAYEEATSIVNIADREYFKLVLASKRLKYMKLAKENSDLVRALDNYHNWLQKARKTGRAYIPVPEERPDKKEPEQLQTRGTKLPIKKQLFAKWMRMLDFYSRQDCKQIIIDALRLTNATMEYVDSDKETHPEFYKDTLQHWADYVITEWHDVTLDHYKNDPDPDNEYGYGKLSLEEITSLVLRDFRIEYDEEDDEGEEDRWAA